MALEEMSLSRWSADIYHKVRRFLKQNVNKPWAPLLAQLHSKVDSRTYIGQELRRAIGHEVDEKGMSPKDYYFQDYYVDEQGILRAYPESSSWRSSVRKKRETAPIDRIQFKDDGPDLYYELKLVPAAGIEVHQAEVALVPDAPQSRDIHATVRRVGVAASEHWCQTRTP